MLVKLSEVELCGAAIAGPLEVRAELLTRSADACAYAFEVDDVERGQVARGRLLVAFTAPGEP